MIAPIDPRATLQRNHALIQRIVLRIGHRNGLDSAEVEELTSWSVERLVDNDYAVLRKFDDRGSFQGYLGTVLERLALDYKNERWGRWRSSVAAKTLGPTAARLEHLIYRDRRSFREALEQLRTEGLAEDESELRRIFRQLPPRWVGRTVDLAAAGNVLEPVDTAGAVEAAEHTQAMTAVREQLDQAMAKLPSEDRIILRLLFWEDLSVADVARRLNLPQKPLYRRIAALRSNLRHELERQGLDGDRFSELLDSETVA